MKKILFSLVALVCSMSMNAQQVKLMKGNTVVATYSAAQVDNVVFEKATTTGTAKRTGNIVVNWVQLWENGPKFAEYNVGVTDGQATSHGDHYCWGKSTSTHQDSTGECNNGSDALTGDDDTATKLWGSAWRMPTAAEFQALCDESKCTKTWKWVNGVRGYEFKGKGDYAFNSVFFPTAGECYRGEFFQQGYHGYYWSSSPNGSRAQYLLFHGAEASVATANRDNGFSVRAVLAE